MLSWLGGTRCLCQAGTRCGLRLRVPSVAWWHGMPLPSGHPGQRVCVACAFSGLVAQKAFTKRALSATLLGACAFIGLVAHVAAPSWHLAQPDAYNKFLVNTRSVAVTLCKGLRWPHDSPSGRTRWLQLSLCSQVNAVRIKSRPEWLFKQHSATVSSAWAFIGLGAQVAAPSWHQHNQMITPYSVVL